MYEDLYQFLIPGFLTTRVVVDNHSYRIRSLGPNDLYLISGAARQGNPEWKWWSVAASIWMVDGMNLLEDSSYAPKVIFDVLRSSNKRLVSHLFCTVMRFFHRARRASEFLESFLYEEESRRLWQSMKNGEIPIYRRSGVPGVERLGMTAIQNSWTAWNQLEDIREQQEYIWSNTKVQVSIHSGKSAKNLDARDKNRQNSEKARRNEVHVRAYRKFLGEDDSGGKTRTTETGLTVRKQSTNDDLVEEMRALVAGEKDDHDIIVENYKNHIRQQIMEREEEQQRLLEEVRIRKEQELEEMGRIRPRLVTLTPKELAEKFPMQQRYSGVQRVIEGDPVSHTFNRYLRQEPANLPGLESRGDQLIVNSIPEMDPPLPINALIASRKPRLDGE